ncbi:hypothetical protein TSUD_112360 [Trifolium subterraneum]|uniref:Peptide deformylase n=1 Tax=Trifolium subterraneum TaxID=3900 RepID=A0A2Z6P837_TRISU|nr:hypothetical protein TSUD_112360 [Trifolium subterraneum]
MALAAARRLLSRIRVIPLPAAVGAAGGVGLAGGAYACNCSSNSKIPALNTKHLSFSSTSSSSSLCWKLPSIVKAGDPVLHQPALNINPTEIKSEKIQKIIDDMILVMRKSPGVGLAAPQIGIPFRIIVLEDKEEYISYSPEEETKAQDRRPFDLLVILNPKLKNKSNRTAFFFEGCLSVDRFQAVVERYLDVEVSGFDRNGEPIKINASGWQARILQHECDHLDGTLYVDKMVPKTFRYWRNMDMPLAHGCPKLGPRA